jgi:hypothetical protein
MEEDAPMPLKSSFSDIWRRITDLEGETFSTKSGLKFTYHIEESGTTVRLDGPRTGKGKRSHMSQFQNALPKLPADGPSALGPGVWGDSYVWGIMMDPRVSRGEW